jgi:flotillin
MLHVQYICRLSLNVMTLNPVCESVETREGVPLTVTGVAQVKVMTEKDLLATACEQFLGKSVDQIKSVVLQTMEGHLRAILGQYYFFPNQYSPNLNSANVMHKR